jgi:hypothetical protein
MKNFRIARKCLQDAGLQSFIKLKRCGPRGSVKYSKNQVATDYKRILREMNTRYNQHSW